MVFYQWELNATQLSNKPWKRMGTGVTAQLIHLNWETLFIRTYTLHIHTIYTHMQSYIHVHDTFYDSKLQSNSPPDLGQVTRTQNILRHYYTTIQDMYFHNVLKCYSRSLCAADNKTVNKKWDRRVRTGLIWVRTDICGRLFRKRQWTFDF
jgi:hypothetical protein